VVIKINLIGIEVDQKLTLTRTVAAKDPTTACEFLAKFSSLSKGRVKDAMSKGAVWLKRSKRGQRRIRRAQTTLRAGDCVSIYYDSALLSLIPKQPELISDQKRFSVWSKPPGMLSQGTKYGDHCALLRRVEQTFRSQRKVYLVHRLDREASGLVLIAHDRIAAAQFSDLFKKQQIIKTYAARVRGNPARSAPDGAIDSDLDGKPARTEFTVEAYDGVNRIATVRIVICSGRKHQIRRHFDIIGHPVIGDPRYGMDNKNRAGLQLVATGLEFKCPFSKQIQAFKIQYPFSR
jgi:tRNA pseudouridine32 synthase/23S rRNA pseudouridine746 synthase